jgi:hypothetical protein
MPVIIISIILSPLFILLSFIVAMWVGYPKKIGFWWTFFFCLTLSPIIGIFMAMSSRKKEASASMSPFVQTLILYTSLISLVVGMFLIASSLVAICKPSVIFFLSGSGFIGIGIYCIQLLPKEVFDDELL